MNTDTLKAPLFFGAATALITPFRDDKIDEDALGGLIDMQIRGGIAALVLCGTTGESPTIRPEERDRILDFAAARVRGRVPLWMGVGANDTATTLQRCRSAAAHGADGLLIVTPYYNKGTHEGVVRHYLAAADSTDLPVMLYNVPSRTGVNLTMAQIERLSRHPNIRAIKEASPDLERVGDLCRFFGDRLAVYSGNDTLTLPTLSLGGVGVVSVTSNLLPAEMQEICMRFRSGDTEDAQRLQLSLYPLMQALFAETNPAPVKCAMALRGLCREEMRLPLCPVGDLTRARLAELLP